MKTIIQIFAVTLCLAMLGQSYLQAGQYHQSISSTRIVRL